MAADLGHLQRWCGSRDERQLKKLVTQPGPWWLDLSGVSEDFMMWAIAQEMQ